MADEAFKVGDVVMLKSGGPKMTVSFVSDESGLIECTWFDKSGERKHDEFSPDTLTEWSLGIA